MDKGRKKVHKRQRMRMPELFGGFDRLARDLARPLTIADHPERPGAESPTRCPGVMPEQFDLSEWIARGRNRHGCFEVSNRGGRLATIDRCHGGGPPGLHALVSPEPALGEGDQSVGDLLRGCKSRPDQLARPEADATLKPLARVTDLVGQLCRALITTARSGGCVAARCREHDALEKTQSQFFIVSRRAVPDLREQRQRALQLNRGLRRRRPSQRLDSRRSVIGDRTIGAIAVVEMLRELAIRRQHGRAIPLQRLGHIRMQHTTTSGRQPLVHASRIMAC